MISQIYRHRHIEKNSRRFFQRAATALFLLCVAAPLAAQQQKPDLPDPIKFMNTYDQVVNVTRAVLDDMGFDIERDDRKGGRITTRPYEFITGSLTLSELEKVAVRKETASGNWIKARYKIEAVIEIVSQKETMVTINADVEGLSRDVDGTEKWIKLDSLGAVERRVLGRISVKLLGTDAPAESRKGFWGQKPQPVNPRQPGFPGPVR